MESLAERFCLSIWLSNTFSRIVTKIELYIHTRLLHNVRFRFDVFFLAQRHILWFENAWLTFDLIFICYTTRKCIEICTLRDFLDIQIYKNEFRCWLDQRIRPYCSTNNNSLVDYYGVYNLFIFSVSDKSSQSCGCNAPAPLSMPSFRMAHLLSRAATWLHWRPSRFGSSLWRTSKKSPNPWKWSQLPSKCDDQSQIESRLLGFTEIDSLSHWNVAFHWLHSLIIV